MNIHIPFSHRPVFRWIGLGVLLLLLSCSLPSLTATSESCQPADAPEPAAGSGMQWLDTSTFVYIPPGEFIMGVDEPKGMDNTPSHKVTLGGFWIQKTEVTNRMYAQCVSLGLCTPPHQETDTPYWYADPAHGDDPVVGVDWNQAQAYCKSIRGILPSEAMWEETARGTKGQPYPWGEDNPACDLATFKDCFEPPATPEPAIVLSHPKGASPFKAVDMAGNVFEWVNDWYAEDYYADSPAANPPGPANGTQRVFRGGSYLGTADGLNISLRAALEPEKHQADLGFRCVLTGETTGQTACNPQPPPCQVRSWIPRSLATETPSRLPIFRTPEISGAFCREIGGGQLGQVNIDFGGPVGDPDQYDISLPSGDPIDCFYDPGFPNIISCMSSSLVPGTEVTIIICSTPAAPSLPNQEPTCPAGYEWDETSGLCAYSNPAPGEGPEDCSADETWVEGYGCMPLQIPGDLPCPPGYFPMSPFPPDPSKPDYCMSFGDLFHPSTNPSCPGGTFVPAQNCCQLPSNASPVCPPWYTYDAALRTCIPVTHVEVRCNTLTIFIPPCTPPVTCGQHTDSTSCTNDPACYWYSYALKPGGECRTK